MFENPPAPKRVKESRIEKAFTEWCKSVGLRQKKLAIIGERSYPDRTVYLGGGRICCVELKAPGGKATVNQLRCHEWLREEGIPVIVSDDLKEIVEWVHFLRNYGQTGTNQSSGPHTGTS